MHLGLSNNLQWSLFRIPHYWSILWPQLSRNYPIRLQQISCGVPCWSYSVQGRIYCHLVNRLIRYTVQKDIPCVLSVDGVHFILKFLSLLQDVEESSMLMQAPSNLPIILRISQPILNVPGPSSPMMETIWKWVLPVTSRSQTQVDSVKTVISR